MYYLIITVDHGSYDSSYTEITDLLYLDRRFELFALNNEYHTWFYKLLDGLKGSSHREKKKVIQNNSFSHWLQKKKGFKKVRQDHIEYT